MKYKKIVSAKFLSRPNRFIANVLLSNETLKVHVKNTGRCKELLVPGATVYLCESEKEDRKTKYDLVAVEKKRNGKKDLLINMDSQAPNTVFYEWLLKGNLFSKNAKIRREVVFSSSRFDFYVEEGDKKVFVEVKGVTLEKDGVCLFPDAPTQRGVKHIEELIKAKEAGYDSYLVFVIQMSEAEYFTPNAVTHKEFELALSKAKECGVSILAFSCFVSPDSLVIDRKIPVCL